MLVQTVMCSSRHILRHRARHLVRLMSTDLLPTSQQFPELKRGNYAKVSQDDLEYFQGIMGKDRVVTDSAILTSHNTDWMKMYKGLSEILLRPKTTEEVSAILKHCSQRGIAVCPQAGNTGLVGGSVPVFDEVILSTSLMNQIIQLDTTAGILQCEAGCILETLDQYVREEGFILPIDLGAKGSCQIGGNVSTNAGGVRFLRYGSLHGNVLGLEVVLSNGEVLDLMSVLKKDNTGYDLKQLFIGAEGTLGIITKVALQCPSKPKSMYVAFLGTSSFEEVLKTFRLAKKMLSEVLSSFEVMDQQSIEPIKKYYNMHPPIEPNNFYMLLEVTGSNEEHDEAKLNAFLEEAMGLGHVKDGTIATSLTAVKSLWSIREHIPLAHFVEGKAYKYDISLPLNSYYQLVEDLRERLKGRQADVVGYGHVGDNNLHLTVVAPSYEKETLDLIEPYIYKWAQNKKGSGSGEHGIGIMNKQALSHSKQPNSIKYMEKIKRLYDPAAILNPYKLF